MQRNGMRLSFMINQFENAGSIFWKCGFNKRHQDNFVPDPVVITDNEFAATKFLIPADTMEQVLNGHHDRVTRLQGF